jgi:hypothetical protein
MNEAKEAARERREEQKTHLHAVWEEMGDWRGRCRKCGETLLGTPKALREHRCEEAKA